MLPKNQEATAWREASARWQSKNYWQTIRDRYQASSRREKSRILDEFIAVTGHHRKHGIRLLGRFGNPEDAVPGVKSWRIYDEAVREAVIVAWGSFGPDLREEAEGGVAPSG